MTEQLSDYLGKARRIASGKNALKIALLSNFTIKGLREVLIVKCHRIGISTELYEAGYGQISQEILAPQSALREFEPDITFLLTDQQHILGDVCQHMTENADERIDFIENRTSEALGTMRSFTQTVSGMLVVSNLPQLSYSPLGIGEGKALMSLTDMVRTFNQRLKDESRDDGRVFVYDLAAFFARYGEQQIIDDRLHYLGDILIKPEYLPLLGDDLMGYVKPYRSKNRKCIVLDLDNTLWGGILGEDGFNNIDLGDTPRGRAFSDFQGHLLALQRRGIILAINSRNNQSEALKVIREHPNMVLREEHFACVKINWENKLDNMLGIANEINIGSDSLVFFDDDPVNRALIEREMPEVLVVDLPKDPSRYVRILKRLNDFNTLQITREDFNKGKLYSLQKKRQHLKSKHSDLKSFLKDLKIEAVIAKANNFTIPRISQLTMKTNQFNLTSRRYSEDEVRRVLESGERFIYTVGVKDRFGDNGLTGVIILEHEDNALKIDTFLLSCRVIGRDVEKAMLCFIRKAAEQLGVNEIVGEYIPTKKNAVCAGLYKDAGFKSISATHFKLKRLDAISAVDYISVHHAGGFGAEEG